MIQVVVIVILAITAFVTMPFKGNDSFLALINSSSTKSRNNQEAVVTSLPVRAGGDKQSKFKMTPLLSPLSPSGVTKKLVTELVSPIPLVTFSSFPVSHTQSMVMTPSPSASTNVAINKPVSAISSPLPLVMVSPTPSLYVQVVPPSLSPILTPTPSDTALVTPPIEVSPSEAATPSNTETPSPTPSVDSGAVQPVVLINEIAWMGTLNSANDEWIELHNPSVNPVDLSGWTLKAQDGTPSIMIGGKSIPAEGYLLFERTDNSTVPGIEADQIYTGALGNGGEYLELRDNNGNLVDFVPAGAGWEQGDNATKSPMARLNSLPAGNDLSNWSTGISGGTPKSGNVTNP